jgi:hypothetical protein
LLAAATVLAQYELPSSAFPQYGQSSGTQPSYSERATLLWLNMARTAPTQFRDNFLTSRVSDQSAASILTSR